MLLGFQLHLNLDGLAWAAENACILAVSTLLMIVGYLWALIQWKAPYSYTKHVGIAMTYASWILSMLIGLLLIIIDGRTGDHWTGGYSFVMGLVWLVLFMVFRESKLKECAQEKKLLRKSN